MRLETFLKFSCLLNIALRVRANNVVVCSRYERSQLNEDPKCGGQTIIFKRHEAKKESGETGYGEQVNCDEFRESVVRLEERLEERSRMLQMSVEKLERRTLQLEKEANATKQQVLEAKLVSSRRDCNDVADQEFTTSGVYEITVNGSVVSVYCDFETDGEKWLVFQRRLDGSVDFFLYWEQYVRGFGSVEHEFWLGSSRLILNSHRRVCHYEGLENIHSITNSGSYQLRVDLEDWEGNTAYAVYSSFSVGDSASNYRLQVSGYSGTAGDSLDDHNNLAFTTRDRDNDELSTSCAGRHLGAWWYRDCGFSSLNGRYRNSGAGDHTGVGWDGWKSSYSMKKTEMKISRN